MFYISEFRIIAFTNRKSDVGRITTTEHVSIVQPKNRNEVLIVDFDPQDDSTACLGWKKNDAGCNRLIDHLQNNEEIVQVNYPT